MRKNHLKYCIFNRTSRFGRKIRENSLKMKIPRKDWELLNRIAWSILNWKLKDEENYLNLESSIDTFKILGRLDTPIFVHILISSLCKTINLIRPETNESNIIKIAS